MRVDWSPFKSPKNPRIKELPSKIDFEEEIIIIQLRHQSKRINPTEVKGRIK